MALPARAGVTRVDIDTTMWPIVVVTPPLTPMTHELVERFKVEWTDLLNHRTERYVCINDLSHAPSMPPAQRRSMTDWMNENERNLAAQCCATAMVFDSMLMRGALTAMLWMFRPPYPTEVFKTREDALRWAREMLDRNAQKPTPKP